MSISQIFLRNLLYRHDFEKKSSIFLSHKTITRRYFTKFWINSEISFNCSNFTNFRKEFSKSTLFLENSTVTQSAQFIKTISLLSVHDFFVCYDFWQKRYLSPGALSCCHSLLSRLSLVRQCFGGKFKHLYLKKKEIVNQMRSSAGWWISTSAVDRDVVYTCYMNIFSYISQENYFERISNRDVYLNKKKLHPNNLFLSKGAVWK